MKQFKANQTAFATPHFRVLSDDQIELIYEAALDVLMQTGGEFYSEDALDLFKKSEAVVSDGNRVRVPPALVKRALNSTPDKINVSGRTGEHIIKLQKNEVCFGTGSDQPFALDRQSGELRRCTYQDVFDSARLVDCLPNYHFHMSHGLVSDVPNPKTYDRHQFMAMIKGCTKPLIVTCVDRDGLEDIWRMASMIRGGADELRINPLFILYIEPISPLRNGKDAVQKLLFAVEKGIPIVYTPCPSSGATAPATMAGMLVQSVAEVLLAVVLCYLKKPGTPVVMGGVTTIMDMLTSTYSYGAPELALTSAANTDISKWLGLPMFSTGGCTDAKVLDEQAAIEFTTSLYYAFLSGANLIHDVGYLDSGKVMSLDSLVLNDEIIGMVSQFGVGIPTDDKHLGLDVISEVGPGGEFVTHEHTFEHWREWYMPNLQDRSDWETWNLEGKKSLNDRLYEETTRLLKEHQPPPMDEDLLAALEQVIKKAEEKNS